MSLLTKVLKLAQELDSRGLFAEADVLDKFAHDLPSADPLDEDELAMAETVEHLDWMDPEAYMDMFRELFLHNNTEEGMSPTAAASAAVRTMNRLAKDIAESPDPTDEERERARGLTEQQLDFPPPSHEFN
jgi:hypothetical protein